MRPSWGLQEGGKHLSKKHVELSGHAASHRVDTEAHLAWQVSHVSTRAKMFSDAQLSPRQSRRRQSSRQERSASFNGLQMQGTTGCKCKGCHEQSGVEGVQRKRKKSNCARGWEGHHLRDVVLRLGNRHAVSGHDDHAGTTRHVTTRPPNARSREPQRTWQTVHLGRRACELIDTSSPSIGGQIRLANCTSHGRSSGQAGTCEVPLGVEQLVSDSLDVGGGSGALDLHLLQQKRKSVTGHRTCACSKLQASRGAWRDRVESRTFSPLGAVLP
eukprot:1294737-Rhodomonas_salina.8